MMPISIGDIAEIVHGELLFGNPELLVTGIAISTSTVNRGDMFVAFVGQQVDGHQFIGDALHRGAHGAMVSKLVNTDDLAADSDYILRVDNPLLALQCLALLDRKKFMGPVIGVTGSNGKTTTKDMLSVIFETVGPCLATQGNYNNELGLPLTLLRRLPHHQSIVVEMGMRGFQEIAELCKIARPTLAVITNIGQSHIGKLGSQENIALAKGELVEALDENGVAILNYDDVFQRDMAKRCKGKIVWYGLDDAEHAYATKIHELEGGTSFTAMVLGEEITVHLNTYGLHNVRNALAALLAGRTQGLDMAAMALQLNHFAPSVGRLRVVPGKAGRTIIDDCYNASPLSTVASLQVLETLAKQKESLSVAILGDMYELGDFSESGHREVGEFSAKHGIQKLIAIGPLSRWTAETAHSAGCPYVIHYESIGEAIANLQHILPREAIVLIKASRGMKLEEVVLQLTESHHS